MKKIKYLLSVLFLGVLSIVFMPNVFAGTIEFGEIPAKSNTMTIPVNVKLEAGETLDSVEIACKVFQIIDSRRTKNSNLKCTVVSAVDGQENWISTVNSGKTYFTYSKTVAGDNDEDPATSIGLKVEEDTTLHIADIKVENSSSSGPQVIVDLDVAKYNNHDQATISTEPFDMKAAASTQTLSEDATFKTLKFTQGTLYPNFSSEVTEYTLYNIADTVNSTTFSYECDKCSIDTIFDSKTISGKKIELKAGLNTVLFNVTSQNGANRKSYTVTIYRGKTTFNSAKLKELSFGEYTMTPAFSVDITDYSITVPNKVNNLNNIIKYKEEDEGKATVKVTGLDNFKDGANKLIVEVTSASGEETVKYNVTVNRLKAGAVEITRYHNGEVTYKDAEGIASTLKEADFKAQYPDQYQEILDGKYKFDKDGYVTTGEEPTTNEAGDDTPGEEKKEEGKDEEDGPNYKLYLIIGLIGLGLLIIIVAGIFIFKKKSDDSEDEEEDDSEDDDDEDDDEEDEDSEESTEPEGPIGEDFSDDVTKTVDVDVALNDLMSTKQYEFNLDNEDEDLDETKEDE